MRELELKYGCNPNQKPSKIYTNDGRDLPIEVLSGRPGYINFMDAAGSLSASSSGQPISPRLRHLNTYRLREQLSAFPWMTRWPRFIGLRI